MIRNVLAMTMLLAIGLAAWSVWQQLDRPVRAVRVEGPLSVAEQQAIRRVVSESLEPGILSLDLEDLGRRIRSLSWPRTVQVRRVWPDGLAIRVEKESVVAAWGDGGYLNSAGKVVKLAEGSEGVPTLSTSMAPPRRAMEVYQMLASRLQPRGFRIVRLEENELGEWLLTLERGVTVALGNEAVGPRLGRFVRAWERGLNARADEIAHVDTRYGNGVAVRWTGRPMSPDAEESGSGEPSHTRTSETDYALR